MAHFIVERFVPGSTSNDVRLWAQALGASIEALGVGGEITHLGSELMSQDETCLCFFDAVSADLVRKINDHAGTPYERILAGEAVRHPTGGENG